MIHPTALVHPDADISPTATIGPWVSVGADVAIGASTVIESHSIIKGPTTIGADNHIFPFCSIGDAPQDKKFSESEMPSRLEIGNGNTIREYCSINRGTPDGGGVTLLGDGNWIMAYSHIAHDCIVGSHNVFANNSTLAGHVHIADFVTLGGFSGVHQFCRLGEGSFTAIASVIVRDVPPFVIVKGNVARPRAVNTIGLTRRGFNQADIRSVKRCFRGLYREGQSLNAAMCVIEKEALDSCLAQKMLRFLEAVSQRGLAR